MTCDPLLLAPRAAWPVLDDRDAAALLAELVARLPGFVPEWQVPEGSAGRALLAVEARYLEILVDGLNRLPERSLLAFLDLFGASLTPAQSARVPLVFSLLPTSPSDVQLPAQSSVAASPPPAPPSLLAPDDAAAAPPAPTYYTTQSVAIGRAQLVALRSVDPGVDSMTDCSANLASGAGFTAFDDRTPVGHVLYLGHATLFALTGTAEVVLSIAFAEGARPERLLVARWEYLSADGWLPLQVTDDGTRRFTTQGQLTLAKCRGPDSKQDAVDGVTSNWIRATLDTSQPFTDIDTTASVAIDTSAAAGWSMDDVLLVDGVARGVVQSVDGVHVQLQQAVHFDVGEAIDVTGKASALVALAPVTSVGVAAAYPFLDGDAVTVDGQAAAIIERLRPGTIEFAQPLAGAEPGGRFFLAATLPPLRAPELDALGPLPQIQEVLARLGLSKSGLLADQAFSDSTALDLGSPFYAFGQQPAAFATFYVASDEAFVLAGAQVQLEFTLARAVEAGGAPVLSWEWFDGQSWQALGIVQDLLDATASLTVGGIVRFDRDPATGTPIAAWVRWQGLDVLFDAGPDDRVYTLERSAGLLRFGDDRHGRVPPAGARVVASFATGGGVAGNVPAGTITQLRSGVAYVQGVTNPLAASGGAGGEALAGIEARGPQSLRNRGRSVSYEDYEWLAREASPDVARVRCLPLTGPDGRPTPGWVGLLAAPQGTDPLPRPTPEFTRRIRDFLAQHCPATVASRIGIDAPRYVQVGVVVTVVPLDPGDAAMVGQRVRDACDAFLHPLSGGPAGAGWQFGESVYSSQFAALLEAVEGVDYCASLQLVVGDRLAGDRIVVGPDGIIAAGPHEVDVALAVPVGRAVAGAS